jgi:hypothetical protein
LNLVFPDPPVASSSRPPAPRKPPARVGNVKGLADFAVDEEESDEEDMNEYFAGGHKR